MIWNKRGEKWRGLKDELDNNQKNNWLKFIKWTKTMWHIKETSQMRTDPLLGVMADRLHGDEHSLHQF